MAITNREKQPVLSITNPMGYKVLIVLSMLYMNIMLLNAILTNRYIGTNSFFLLGGGFHFTIAFHTR